MCARRRTFFWRNPLRGLSCAAKVRCAHGALVLKHSSPKRRQKKAKEGDPTVCVPALRSGQPAVLASSGVSLKLAALRQSRALIRWPLRSSAHTEGLGSRTANIHKGHRCARPHLAGACASRWAQACGLINELALASTSSARTGGGSTTHGAQRRSGRAQRRPVWLFGCSAAPPCGCACGGAVAGWHGRRSAHASSSDSPRLFERSTPGAQ